MNFKRIFKNLPQARVVGNRGIDNFNRSIYCEGQAMHLKPWILSLVRRARLGSCGLTVGAFIALIVPVVGIVGCNDPQAQAVAAQERAFDIEDFQWKEFIQALYSADFENAKTQSSDQVFLMLLYLKDMNGVFSDPTMSAFFAGDGKCFTQLYEPKLNAMLEAVVWGEQVPKILLEILSLSVKSASANRSDFNAKYPFLGSILGNLREQIPQGRLQQLAFVVRLRQILRDRAKKDALTLFSDYGCENSVTRAVYKNAVHFAEMEPLKTVAKGN